jgi:carbohydrate-selective porin OprB
MLRGFRCAFGKLAMVSGFALILVMFALPTFALTGDQPATVDTAAAADPQSSTTPAVAPAPPPMSMAFMHQDYMLNWGPDRQRLADKGFTFNFFYITDALGDPTHPAGTDLRFSNWQRIRGTIDYDFGKTSAAKGLSFHATGVWQNGVNMGGVIGSVANPSGIVSFHQFRLDSIWLSQKLAHDKVVVTAGFMASQDFYGLQEYGGSFINEPMDYNFGNMGNVRASYDPETGPGAEIKIIPNKHFYGKTGIFLPSDDSHVAGHEYRPTFLNYKSGDYGATWDTEVGYMTDAGAPSTRKSYPGIIKAGFIYNGSKAGSYSPVMGNSGFLNYSTGTYEDHNYTFYFQANQPVFRVAAGSNRGLDVTFGGNIAPASKSQISAEFTAGAIFNGPIEGRPKDGLAFGLVYSKWSGDYNTFFQNDSLRSGPGQTIHAAASPTGIPALLNEKLFEFNYKAMIAPWLTFQPVYQFYASVGGSSKSAAIAGFRLVTTF